MLRNLTLGCLKLIGALKQVYGMIKSVFYKDYSDSMKKLKINLETIVIIRHWPWKFKKKAMIGIKQKFFLNWAINTIQSLQEKVPQIKSTSTSIEA